MVGSHFTDLVNIETPEMYNPLVLIDTISDCVFVIRDLLGCRSTPAAAPLKLAEYLAL